MLAAPTRRRVDAAHVKRRLELDIAAFQELWTRSAREQLIAAGHRAGLVHAWQPEATWRGSGLTVLSRSPIRNPRFHPFRQAGAAERIHEADYLGRKGFVECVIDTPDGPVGLVNTHLQADYTRRDRSPYVPYRTAQVVQIAAALRATPYPVLLAGDLNFTESSPEYAIFTGLTGLADVAASLDRRRPTWLPTNPYTAENGFLVEPDREIREEESTQESPLRLEPLSYDVTNPLFLHR